MQGQKNIKKNR